MTFFAIPGKSVVSKSPNEMETNKVSQESQRRRCQHMKTIFWAYIIAQHIHTTRYFSTGGAGVFLSRVRCLFAAFIWAAEGKQNRGAAASMIFFILVKQMPV